MSDFPHEQLLALALPFPQRVIRTNPSGGGSYVPHHLYAQRLLLHLGRYDFTLVEVIRGDVAGKAPNPDSGSKRGRDGSPPLSGVVVGVIARLGVNVDGHNVEVEDVGDCEDPHNWPHDGARLKDAFSDALKRCSARIGLGTHLYADNGEYVLADALKSQRNLLLGVTEAQQEEAEESDAVADLMAAEGLTEDEAIARLRGDGEG